MEKRKSGFTVPVYVRWIGWVLLVQFVLINISASLYAYKLTHIYDDPSLRNERPSSNIFIKTWRLFTGPRQPRSFISDAPTFPVDTVVLKTKKGIPIEAWYSRADSGSRGTIILFHGVTANKGMLLNEAYEFRYLGYDVMMVDFRGHGNSGGKTTTLGIRETEEVKLAYEYVAEKKPKQVFLWGTSMGAVVITKAVTEYNLSPAGIIIESPFASMQSHLRARARAMGFQGLPEKPFGFFVTWWIGLERGVRPFKYCTANFAEKIKHPVLMQWGSKDRFVLKNETDGIFNALSAPAKKLVIYESAGHESLLLADPVKWREEMEQFLNTHSK